MQRLSSLLFIVFLVVPWLCATAWTVPSRAVNPSTSSGPSMLIQMGTIDIKTNFNRMRKPLPGSTTRLHSDLSIEHPYTTRNAVSGTGQSLWHQVPSAIAREIQLTYNIMKGNLLATLILGMSCAVASGMATGGASVFGWTRTLLKSFFWFLGYGYHFDIGNQIDGIEEDRINGQNMNLKKDRPLMTGEITLQGARLRHILSGILWFWSSFLIGKRNPLLPACAMLWIVSSTLTNFCGLSNYFVTKNYVIMTLGSISMLLGGHAIGAATTTVSMERSLIPYILTSSWLGLTADIQDFRDELGDRCTGRKTTSALWGVGAARKVWAVQFVLFTSGLLWTVRKSLSVVWDGPPVAGAITLLLCTLQNKTVHHDNVSYGGFVCLAMAFFLRAAFWGQVF